MTTSDPGSNNAPDEHDGHDGHDHDAHDGHDQGDHGDHSHAHGGHDHSHDLRATGRRRLMFVLSLIATFMVVEVVGGLLSGSLALLADAANMLTDTASIVLALVAMWLAGRPASVTRTFGFQRTEIMAALANTLSLWVIAGWIFFEAYRRFTDIPDVDGSLVLVVGFGGLLVNVISVLILRGSSRESLNVEGAFQHVIADLLGSVAVVISAILIIFFEWWIADPILSVLIGLLIMRSSWGLFGKVLAVLLEETPAHVDMYALCSSLEDVEGVTLIHDVHAWTITSGFDALTAHVLIDPEFSGDEGELLFNLREIVYHEYRLAHVTLQIERTASECLEDHHVDHLAMRAAT